ncbi:hypothetical protein BIV23_41615 [Streptomyces monashensis]|uniref:OmpR/PhoB-type domain-containing protein n=2 Tax=Streptomyces monashensis TaxID=1678012 RepID=A0A1S2P720_9ACTN|nr:hypothetical protein BIV23_41615 [Streptomyces monashensis]
MVRDLEQGRTGRPHPSSLNRLCTSLGLEADLVARTEPETISAQPPSTTAADGATGVLELLVLGSFEVRRGGASVKLPNGKRRLLLAILALNAGKAVHQDTLVDLLWGDAPPARAHRLLGEYVRTTRQALTPSEPECIDRVGRGFRLNKDLIRRDVDEFLELSELGRLALGTKSYEQAVELTGRALRLWRGTVLQDIDALRDLPELTALLRKRIRTALDLADAHAARGSFGEALDQLEPLAERDPFNESIQARVLVTLARSGQQAEALSRYHALSALLNRELGLRPGPELVEAQRRILNNEVDYEPAANPGLLMTPPAVPQQLPPDTALFTGRECELAALRERIESALADTDARTPTIVAMDGMAGIGKTTLALRAAHLVADRYPDGHLFVDLRGHNTDLPPRTSTEVLAELLPVLGVPLKLIPEDVEARSALYRNRLAGSRTLVVLDDASSADQIRHLLPSSTGCLVLVTSRRGLISLDEAYRLTLRALPDADGYRLLARGAAAGWRSEETEALQELARLCGGLPLALRIVRALLHRRRVFAAGALKERLQNGLTSQEPLSAFDDGERSLRSVFDLSYQVLRRRHRQLFRVLGLMPGPDIDVHGAAALAEIPVDSAQDLLSDLADHNLLVETEPGRFHFHDLLKLDAWTRALEAGENVAEAESRLVDYFEAAARRADGVIRYGEAPPCEGADVGVVEGPRIDTREHAMEWMRAEIMNLLAVARLAVASGNHPVVLSLSASLHQFLQTSGPWSGAVELQAAAVEAARHGDDPRAMASTLARLGAIRRLTGDISGAVESFEAALLSLAPNTAESMVGPILGQLGEAYLLTADYPRASEALRASLAAHTKSGDWASRAEALIRLSQLTLSRSPDPLDALPDLCEALTSYTTIGDPKGQAYALSELGEIYRICGNYASADRALQDSLRHSRTATDPMTQALTLLRLGLLRHFMDDPSTAFRDIREAFSIYEHLGSLAGMASSLACSGTVQAGGGDHKAALESFTKAGEHFAACGNERGRMASVMYAAESRYQIEDRSTAVADVNATVEHFQAVDDVVNEAYAISLKASFVLDAGDVDSAVSLYLRAVDLAKSSRRVQTQLAALRGLSKAHVARGETADGLCALEAAVRLCHELSLPEEPSVRAELAALRAT